MRMLFTYETVAWTTFHVFYLLINLEASRAYFKESSLWTHAPSAAACAKECV